MKQFYLYLIVALIFVPFIHAQEYHSYLSGANLEFKDSTVTIEDLVIRADQDESGFTTVYFDNSEGDGQVSFKIKPFTQTLFEAKFRNSMSKIKKKDGKSLTLKGSPKNTQAITELYAKIAGYFYTVNERPQVATVHLKNNGDSIPVYAVLKYECNADKATSNEEKCRDNSTRYYRKQVGILTDPAVEMSFYAGFIEKIEVRGEIDGVEVTFANRFSIGVSSLANIEKFYKQHLYSKNGYTIHSNKDFEANQEDSVLFSNGKNHMVKPIDKTDDELEENISKGFVPSSKQNVRLEVDLDDVIDYRRIIDVNANDISPAKQKIALDKTQTSAKLFREESTKILEATVYTDLIGALEEESPNGIIQTEVSRRFIVKTSRVKFPLKSGLGAFEYVDGKILLSKIEQDNKFLLPQNEVFDNLSLYQHRNFSVGGSLNLLTYENQNAKLNIFFETGLEFSRSGYQLAEDAEQDNVNALEWNVQVKAHLFPEKRYGIIISDKGSYYEILDNNTEFLGMLNNKRDWINTIEFLAYLDVSTSSKLFVRYTLTHSVDNVNNNFSQLQMGTAFFILEKNRKDN